MFYYSGSKYKAPLTPFIAAGDKGVITMDVDILKSRLQHLWKDGIVDVS